MRGLEITWREIVLPALTFILIIAGFGGLYYLAGWPNAESGWSLVVAVAAIVAFLPLIAKSISFLQQSKASIEGPLGIKLNFAVATSETGIVGFSYDMAQGVVVPESGRGELERAAVAAHKQESVVIDLEDGSAWYESRLFALAATAASLGSPKLLIFTGTKNQKKAQVAGAIAPTDLVEAFTRFDSRYGTVRTRAEEYLDQLRAAKRNGGNPQFAQLPNFYNYQHIYSQSGDAVIMRILVEQLRQPESDLDIAPIEDEAKPVWSSLALLEAQLQPWLAADFVNKDAPIKEQIEAILATAGRFALATRGGRLDGIIDVGQAQRRILNQVVQRLAD